ncbi:hypothetical protein [Qipengyuania nanhaisediminis]|uniref:hypothetical protein n=1 Tax=Qipengyuania nanhaisediminis TaxID=604088 RepID=UPI0038B22F5F
MRALFASLVLLIATSCAPDSGGEEIERLEMRLSGWSSLDVVIDAGGNGTYKDSEPYPDGTRGGFKLARAELLELLAKLQPYHEQAVSFSEESAMRFIMRACPKGVPNVTDAGAFYVRWQSADDDVHYLADFGCDHERLADRNGELRDIVEGLPIPSVP